MPIVCVSRGVTDSEPLLLDVTDQGQIDDAVAVVEDVVGARGLDGLVNNAGIGEGGPLEFLPIEEWRTQLEVNVIGQVALTKGLLPMLRRARGRIVFVGSIGGRIGTPLLGPSTRRSSPSKASPKLCDTSSPTWESTSRSSSPAQSAPPSGTRAGPRPSDSARCCLRRLTSSTASRWSCSRAASRHLITGAWNPTSPPR